MAAKKAARRPRKATAAGPKRWTPREAHDAMVAAKGHRNWWPARTPFEVCVGAILTQIVAWSNVEKAIANLIRANALGPRKMARLTEDELGQLIRPSGYWRQKAKRLRAFLDLLHTRFGGQLPRLLRLPREELRETLLAINGIGRETADCIICYAAEQPIFVVDAYTQRIAYRLGWFPHEKADYEALRTFVESDFPPDADANLLGDAHAQYVHLGATTCTKTNPTCHTCPLRARCPQIGMTPPLP